MGLSFARASEFLASRGIKAVDGQLYKKALVDSSKGPRIKHNKIGIGNEATFQKEFDALMGDKDFSYYYNDLLNSYKNYYSNIGSFNRKATPKGFDTSPNTVNNIAQRKAENFVLNQVLNRIETNKPLLHRGGKANSLGYKKSIMNEIDSLNKRGQLLNEYNSAFNKMSEPNKVDFLRKYGSRKKLAESVENLSDRARKKLENASVTNKIRANTDANLKVNQQYDEIFGKPKSSQVPATINSNNSVNSNALLPVPVPKQAQKISSNNAVNNIQSNQRARINPIFSRRIDSNLGMTRYRLNMNRFNENNPNASFSQKALAHTKALADGWWNGGTKTAKTVKRVATPTAGALIGMDVIHQGQDEEIVGIPFV
ncbi:MAG: hypothetical protein N2043_02380 [Ignavibacterium sp.]|nr:hypothetical protein [Ignavibacterium sp.]